MKIELSDEEVKTAIVEYLDSRVSVETTGAKINRLYLDGSGGFEAVVELPDENVEAPK